MKANKIVLTVALLTSFAVKADGDSAIEKINKSWGMDGGVAAHCMPDVMESWHIAVPAAFLAYVLQAQNDKIKKLLGVSSTLEFIAERTNVSDKELTDAGVTHLALLAFNSLYPNLTTNGHGCAVAGTAFVWAGKNLGKCDSVSLSNAAVGGYLAGLGYDRVPKELRDGIAGVAGLK